MYPHSRRDLAAELTLEPRSPDRHLLRRQETSSHNQLREAPSDLSEASQQQALLFERPGPPLGFWEQCTHFLTDGKPRQIHRLSQKRNESILTSGLEVSPPSLPQDFELGSSKCSVWIGWTSRACQRRGEPSCMGGSQANCLGKQLLSVIETQSTLCWRALKLKIK